MFITVGEKNYELKTNLGVSFRMEQKTKKSVMELLSGIDVASIGELIEMLSFGVNFEANSPELKEFRDALLENWDYGDLQLTTQEFLARLLFSGTPEQTEAKLDKYPIPEEAKNAIRGLLGLKIPSATPSIGNES